MSQTADTDIIQRLPHERILALHRTALACGFGDDATHQALLAGLPPAYVATLPSSGAPSARLMIVLNKLNHEGRLRDGTDPLETWLANAAQAARELVHGIAFEQALEALRGSPHPFPSKIAESPSDSAAKSTAPIPNSASSSPAHQHDAGHAAPLTDAREDVPLTGNDTSESDPERETDDARIQQRLSGDSPRGRRPRRFLSLAIGFSGLLGLVAIFASKNRMLDRLGFGKAAIVAQSSADVLPAKANFGEILLPGGSFVIGSNSPDARDDERLGTLQVIKPFWLDATEVTVRDYRRCMGSSKCTSPSLGPACNMDLAGREAHPVNCVTHFQAVAYCQFVQKRLPTEAEWEWAARGAHADTIPANGPCLEQGKTSEVGMMRDVVSGIFDLRGNVREWTADPYGWYAPGSTMSPSRRVVRGAAWNTYHKQDCRITARSHREPSYYDEGLGFRCARDQ